MHIKELDIKIYMLIFLLPLIFINSIKNLKRLAPFSTAANAVTVVGFGIIFYYIIRDGPTFENRAAIGEVKNFPLFFGTVMFALEAIGVVSKIVGIIVVRFNVKFFFIDNAFGK